MDFTVQSNENLKRFGCDVNFSQEHIYIDLANVDQERMRAATIFVRIAYTNWSKNPLLCLMFEVSPTRILPRYCYYPFNPANPTQMDFLRGIAEASAIHFVLVGSKATVSREHPLKLWQRNQIKYLCEAIKNTIQSLQEYDFPKAVAEFEGNSRIPQMFERVLSDDDISKIVESAKREAAGVPPERRALAQQICHNFAQIFKARSEHLTDEQVRLALTMRAIFMLFVELYREFGNFDDFAEFAGNAVATTIQNEAVLRSALDWSSQVDAGLRWVEHVVRGLEVNQNGVRSDFFETLGSTLGDVARGRPLTLPMLQRVFAALQPFLSDRPGRPSKDYSREFSWKASMSWSEVTRKSLQENPEIREEFGGRNFDSLTFEQQESLKNRIREGVKSWAVRNGKEMPALPDKTAD